MSFLPDADAFRRLVDGSVRGPAATLARAGLAALAVPYAVAVRARNLGYDLGIRAARRAPVPVVAVGNLTLGGTGKTPLVAWVAHRCIAAGRRPAIVSRGYGSAQGQTSDEAAELALVVPGVAHVADRDRVAAAARAAADGADAVVLDDGLQHRRLARDLDIVTIDCTDPFGCGHIFPRGLLREPLAGLARAQAVVLTRADTVEPRRRREIMETLTAAAGSRRHWVWAHTAHAPRRLRSVAVRDLPVEHLAGRRVVAFCGLGNPAAFRRTLHRLGAAVAAFRAFPDHHAYSPADADALGTWAAATRAELVVTTLKDLVKVPHETLGGIPLFAVEIGIDFIEGESALDHLVAAALASEPGGGSGGVP